MSEGSTRVEIGNAKFLRRQQALWQSAVYMPASGAWAIASETLFLEPAEHANVAI